MTLTRVAHKRKVRASNAEARRSGRTFPNHQARCALLILLRFEFANEFRPCKANQRLPACPMRSKRAGRDWLSRADALPHFSPRTGAQSRRQRDQPRRNARPGARAPPVTRLWRRKGRSPKDQLLWGRQGGPNTAAFEPPSFFGSDCFAR